MRIQVSPPEASMAVATPTEHRKAYLQTLLAQRPTDGPDWLIPLRDRALTLIQEQELPSTKHEDWRFTDLRDLYQTQFTSNSASMLAADLAPFLWDGIRHCVVFVNGHFCANLSTLDPLPNGLTFQSLESLDDQNRVQLGQQPGAGEIFTALNSATFQDVAALNVERNQHISAPIHLLFITRANASNPVLSVPRILITVAENASVTLIEDYATLGDGATFTNAVTEISIRRNAQLHHTRIQREGKQSFHLGKSAISQARESRYNAVNLSLGGQLSRHTPEVTLQGEQAETVLDGLTLAAETQLADTHSTLAFTTSHCTAKQLHKCIIDDQARAVFNGKVYVPKAAQQTNAGQLSRNLLLSPKARVDTKPQLEIIADDVKCAHGATVSQLEEDAVFYLQSRGLDRESACDLLVEAFAAEILEKCPVPAMRQGLLRQVLDQIR